MKKICLALVFVFSLVALVGCGNKTSGTVSTDGSTSMEKVISALGEKFESDHSGVTFTYNPTGSSSGIAAVMEGRCDIGLSSRYLKDDEKEKGLTETVLALDGIAIIVNPANSVNDLSLEDIAKIYTGEITNWKEVGGNDAPIVLIGREAEVVQEMVLNLLQKQKMLVNIVKSSLLLEMLLLQCQITQMLLGMLL